jgi:hypothetical protein
MSLLVRLVRSVVPLDMLLKNKIELCVTLSYLGCFHFLSFLGMTTNKLVVLADDLNLNPDESGEILLLRKEVIQPQVPLRLPCYDFIPITGHTLGSKTLRVQQAFMM